MPREGQDSPFKCAPTPAIRTEECQEAVNMSLLCGSITSWSILQISLNAVRHLSERNMAECATINTQLLSAVLDKTCHCIQICCNNDEQCSEEIFVFFRDTIFFWKPYRLDTGYSSYRVVLQTSNCVL